jgi:stage III sporulation protein AH
MIVKLKPILIIAAVFVVTLVGIGCWQLVDWKMAANTPEPPAEPPQISVTQRQTETTEKSFFPAFRLQREKVRSQQLELLQEIINNPNTDDTSKQSALTRLLTITNAMELELKAEGLLQAQGFKEGVVIVKDAAASVIISGPELDETEEELVRSQVAGVLKMKSQQISLIRKD